MKAGFWIKRFFFVAAVLFVILVLSELAKGHGLHAAITFGITWALISTSIVIATGLYYTRKGLHCPLCNNVPKAGSSGK